MLQAKGGDASSGTACGGGSGGTIFISTYYNQVSNISNGYFDVSGGSASVD
jgi:hypothetical protein